MTALKSKPSISLIGSGSLAQALAPALHRAGYIIDELISRDNPSSLRRAAHLAQAMKARAVTLRQARFAASIIWFCVNDDSIASCARGLVNAANWKGKIALHSSGALNSSELKTLKKKGARTGSAHPMMTFVPGAPPRFKGIAFALEGDTTATNFAWRAALDIGMEPFRIEKKNKVLYHAMGSFSSPLVIATLAAAEQVGKAAGIPKRSMGKIMRPILLQTLENYLQHGPAAAFSGPIRRGDTSTVRKHLYELKRVPGAREVYRSLLRVACDELPVKNAAELKRLIQD